MDCDFCDEPYIESCVLQCGHTFHSVCIHRWILYNPTCPLCRVPANCDREHSLYTNIQLVKMFQETAREAILTINRLETENSVLIYQSAQDDLQIQAQQILLLLSSSDTYQLEITNENGEQIL